jgi:hypothetical protein
MDAEIQAMRLRENGTRAGMGLLAALCLVLPACESDGHFTVLGYTTRPTYNKDIKTVRVTIFKNDTYLRGLEFSLTEALIHEIEWKTPYKVVPAWETADTELTGTIVAGTKNTVLFTPLGEIRDADTTLTVQIVWRDLRPGCGGGALTNPLFDPNVPIVPPPTPTYVLPGSVPSPPRPVEPPPPGGKPSPTDPDKVLVQSQASFRPELGESLVTANAIMVRRMARQIVQMMELPF